MSSVIDLTFVNRSDCEEALDISFSSARRYGDGSDKCDVCWLMLPQVRPGETRDFHYSLNQHVITVDTSGDYTARAEVKAGDVFALRMHNEESKGLEKIGENAASGHIEIRNDCARGAISVLVIKNESKLAQSVEFPPSTKVEFVVKPQLFVSVSTPVVEGRPVQSAWKTSVGSEITLRGIVHAEIVMTGGGLGPSATPITFKLENIDLE